MHRRVVFIRVAAVCGWDDEITVIVVVTLRQLCLEIRTAEY